MRCQVGSSGRGHMWWLRELLYSGLCYITGTVSREGQQKKMIFKKTAFKHVEFSTTMDVATDSNISVCRRPWDTTQNACAIVRQLFNRWLMEDGLSLCLSGRKSRQWVADSSSVVNLASSCNCYLSVGKSFLLPPKIVSEKLDTQVAIQMCYRLHVPTCHFPESIEKLKTKKLSQNTRNQAFCPHEVVSIDFKEIFLLKLVLKHNGLNSR